MPHGRRLDYGELTCYLCIVLFQTKIQWFEPDWSYRPRLKSQWKTKVLPFFWKWFFAPAFLSSLLIASLAQGSSHQTDFNWGVFTLVICFNLTSILVIAAIGYWICWLFRPFITLSFKGLSLRHGCFFPYSEQAFGIVKDALTEVKLDLSKPDQPKILFLTNCTKLEIGLDKNTDLNNLEVNLRKWFSDIPFSREIKKTLANA